MEMNQKAACGANGDELDGYLRYKWGCWLALGTPRLDLLATLTTTLLTDVVLWTRYFSSQPYG